MVNIDILRSILPFRPVKKVIAITQATDDIVDEIEESHEIYAPDYDLIWTYFDTGDVYSTCQGLWDFCKYNLPYTIEPGRKQTTKSPWYILHKGEKIDCKHYSLFIGGVLDAIKRNTGDDFEWFYRFANYHDQDFVEHVFIVVLDGEKEIWVDPVLSSFNYDKQPTFYIDLTIDMLYRVGSIPGETPATITVDRKKATQSFLLMLNGNMLALKILFLRCPDVVNGAFRQYCQRNNIDFRIVQNILKHEN